MKNTKVTLAPLEAMTVSSSFLIIRSLSSIKVKLR